MVPTRVLGAQGNLCAVLGSSMCNFRNWKKRKLCQNREAFMNTSKSKVNELFKGEVGAQ